MKEDSLESDRKTKILDENVEINENMIIYDEDYVPKKKSCCKKCCLNIFPYFQKVNTTEKKRVYLKDQYKNYTEWSNKIENHKYNLITFIPIVLFNQFKQFGNFFYLVMSITQFFDQLVVGFLFTYISPLAIVVSISMLKELYDDINRRIQDKKINSTLITVLKHDESNNSLIKIEKTASDLLVGDILEIKKDMRIPADIIILKTFNESNDNQAFIRTDQLDGETDWKLRKAPEITQNMTEDEIITCEGHLECGAPSKLIYNFEGTLNLTNGEKEPLNLENTMWASTVLASQKIIGIVIYTGKESRARMNSSNPKLKIGVLDSELNWTNVYLFCFMFILSLVLTALKGITLSLHTLFTFIKFIILFCSIIPIALRVNLDVSKTWFSLVINRDKKIPDTIARNSTIPEELGRISYIFSDKTGTLTKNEMIFKNLSIMNEDFGVNHSEKLKKILKEECSLHDAPLIDVYNKAINKKEKIEEEKNSLDINTMDKIDIPDTNDINSINIINSINTNNNIKIKEEDGVIALSSDKKEENKKIKKSKITRNKNNIIRDAITSMLICNNVTPIVDVTNQENITYQASSPDEIALVKFAETLNMQLIYRSDKKIKIQNANETEEEYEILANFPFSSETKRMGIVVKNKKYGHIIFYLKGAENVIKNFTKPEYESYINENTENLAEKGLRTLVLTQKMLSIEEFETWNKEYKEAMNSMQNRKEKTANVISKLENNMEFLCVTGVEDVLQDDVQLTIETLRNAGIKIWMLTGDKVETAKCISISAGIKAKNDKIFTIKFDEIKSDDIEISIDNLKQKLEEYKNLVTSHIFILDGETLDLSLKYCEKEFFETTKDSPSVVCCRCSPTQKRLVVKTIKKYVKARTAAVGDGGNDVAMILEADVGIGIVGKEGLQASLAADYSIQEFRYLNDLLLWWGRMAYKNTSTMANFVIHRGLIISVNQFIFSLIFFYNAVALYNGMLCLGYSTVFTALPSISILLDQDINRKNVLKFPNLYKVLLKGRELNFKNFLWWFFKSIFQSTVIMFGAIFLFGDFIFLKIVTVSFTSLIYLEILNVYSEIKKCHWFMAISLLATFIVYTLTLFFLPSVVDIYYIIQLDPLWKMLVISLAAWLPFFIVSLIKRCCFPKEYEKIQKGGEPIL